MNDERGASGVIVALLMVPLLAFGAISIDIAGLYVKKQQLQTGTDAAALAIAADCARGACGTPSTTAQNLVVSNLAYGSPTATVSNLTSSRVTVSAAVARPNLFGGAIKIASSTAHAKSTVQWGGPTGGTALLPLAFSWCEWQQQTGGAQPSGTTARTIYLSKTSGTSDCTGPSNNLVPGGFGWLTTTAGTCKTTTQIGSILNSDPGNSVPSGCTTTDFVAFQNTTVLLPIFDSQTGTGSGATYRVYAYAAFQITGYHFGGQYNWSPSGADPCTGNNRCIRGYFTRMVSLSEVFTYGATAPQLGASVVKITS